MIWNWACLWPICLIRLPNVQVTVTGNIYNYFVMLMLVATNMHYYIIRAIFDSFSYFNVGKAVFHTSLKEIMVDFVANYFMIAVRIVLPIFCCMLIINVVLGVLAKAAPQMNMFVVGIQIKVLVGLILAAGPGAYRFPACSDFIFSEMKRCITQVIHWLYSRSEESDEQAGEKMILEYNLQLFAKDGEPAVKKRKRLPLKNWIRPRRGTGCQKARI